MGGCQGQPGGGRGPRGGTPPAVVPEASPAISDDVARLDVEDRRAVCLAEADPLVAAAPVHHRRGMAMMAQAPVGSQHGRGDEPLEPASQSLPAGHLEEQDAVRLETADELGDVAARPLRVHVLEHDVRVDEVEVRITKQRKVARKIDVVVAAVGILVEASGVVDHRGRDVYAVDPPEMSGQCLREPAHAATEVQGSAALHGDPLTLEIAHHLDDLLDAGLEELVDLPPALLAGHAQDRPEWILLPGLVPHLLMRLEVLLLAGHPAQDNARLPLPLEFGPCLRTRRTPSCCAGWTTGRRTGS